MSDTFEYLLAIRLKYLLAILSKYLLAVLSKYLLAVLSSTYWPVIHYTRIYINRYRYWQKDTVQILENIYISTDTVIYIQDKVQIDVYTGIR